MMNENTTKDLMPAHGWEAARELIADLRAQSELAKYVYPEIWRERNQANNIITKTKTEKLCVAVGMGESRLAYPGDNTQGGRVYLSLAVYLFIPQRVDAAPSEELRQQVALTLLSYLNGWKYTRHGGQPITSRLADIDTVDLSTITAMKGEITADVVRVELPIGLARRA